MSVALDLSTRRKTDRPDEWEGLVDPEPLDVELPRAVEPLTEEEKYLAVLLQDHSGLDQAEFCIGGGQLVITGDGWIPIQDVRVGQLVLTHKNRWRPVSAVYDRGVREVVTVRGQGHPGLVVTPDHQLLVRRARRGTERGDGHRNSVLEPAEWRAPQDFKDLTYRGGKYRSWWWGSPSKAEPLPITPFPEVGKLRVAFGPWEPDWLWLFGHWLSEGNVSDNRAGYSITWSVNPRVLHEVTDRLDNLNLRHSVTNGNNCSDNIDRVAVYSQQLASWLAAEGGRRSSNKRLPAWVLGLPTEGREALFDGLSAGDGTPTPTGGSCYSSTSRQLAFGVRSLATSLGRSASMTHYGEYTSSFGTPGLPYWKVTSETGLGKTFAGEGHTWAAVKEITDFGSQSVWDISVEEDHSFVVEGITVHNCWKDPNKSDNCYRAQPSQWAWWRERESRTMDASARSVGKSESVMADACQFPFNFPDQEFLITAPEGQHVESLTDRIEARINSTRLLREMLVRNRSGIKHKPFVATFQNGARVYARLPQRSGIGLKGTHPVILHVDEAQDMSEQAWREMPEIVRNDVPGNKWKIHGVSKGIQGDSFDKYSRPDSGFKVFNITGLHREGWSKEERADKVKQYGGSDRSPDFLRNVYGMPGASSNRIFVLTRLMAGCDVMEASDYNTNEYYKTHISADHVIGRLADKGVSELDASTEEMADVLAQMIQPPTMHTSMHSVFWMGADIGVVSDPTEIVVWAEYVPDKAERQRDRRANIAVPDAGMTRFKLVSRIRLEQIPLPLQARVVMHLINIYKPRAFTLDRTGVGHGLLQNIQQLAGSARFVIAEEADDPRNAAAASAAGDALTVIKGYNFSEKVVIGIDEKMVDDLHLSDPGDILEKASIRQHAKDASTDVLRDLVDTRRLKIPYDHEVIDQMNGQTWTSSREPVDKYGRRRSVWSIGTFHILDGCRMFALGWAQQPIEAMFAEARKPSGPVIARFGL